MQSVVHHPVQSVTTSPPLRRRASTSWASTVRLGVVASVVAILVAVVVHLLTPVPSVAIVVGLALGAFALSWRASANRRPHHR